ncbi:hypothetical protein BDW62DRAFT_194089 [Aspergillus aurantiobrunneus]
MLHQDATNPRATATIMPQVSLSANTKTRMSAFNQQIQDFTELDKYDQGSYLYG